jgi:hypothetical protein
MLTRRSGNGMILLTKEEFESLPVPGDENTNQSRKFPLSRARTCLAKCDFKPLCESPIIGHSIRHFRLTTVLARKCGKSLQRILKSKTTWHAIRRSRSISLLQTGLSTNFSKPICTPSKRMLAATWPSLEGKTNGFNPLKCLTRTCLDKDSRHISLCHLQTQPASLEPHSNKVERVWFNSKLKLQGHRTPTTASPGSSRHHLVSPGFKVKFQAQERLMVLPRHGIWFLTLWPSHRLAKKENHLYRWILLSNKLEFSKLRTYSIFLDTVVCLKEDWYHRF